MPRLMATAEDQVIAVPGPGNFQFSAVRIEDLGASEYTLVTIVCDKSGSVIKFANKLLDCVKTIVEATQKSPRSENLLIRKLLFNTELEEVHGFRELSNINVADYPPIDCDSMTALYDATYDAIGATLTYSEKLIEQDFDCNGIVFVITDGMDNRSSMTPSAIKKLMEDAQHDEKIESLQVILITLRSPGSSWAQDVDVSLERFYKDANLTQKVDLGEATSQRLAKLAGFVSESISSQSQALGTGAPSQSLAF